MLTLRRTCAVVLFVAFAACRKESPAPEEKTPPIASAPTPMLDAGTTAPAAPGSETPPMTPPAEALRLASGTPYVVLHAGTGSDHPTEDDHVVVHYSLWQPPEALIDSTVIKQKPATLLVVKTPQGWPEAIKQLVVGEKARFWLPGATGADGQPLSPKVLEMELLQIRKGAPPAAAPPDLKTPPQDAVRLPTGLMMKVLKAGTGRKHPKVSDKVAVNFTGWTEDGQVFDSSHGQTFMVQLSDRIRGWQEGVVRLVEGDTARLWIPPQLAYSGRSGPTGTLVFDIELVKIADTASNGKQLKQPGR